MARRVCIVNKASGCVCGFYEDVFAAAAAMGQRVDKVRGWLDNRSLPCERVYVPRYADEYDPNESFAGKINRPVVVVHVPTRRAACVPGVQSAMVVTGGSRSAVERACRSGGMINGEYCARPLDFMGQGFKRDVSGYRWARSPDETVGWCSRGRWRRESSEQGGGASQRDWS